MRKVVIIGANGMLARDVSLALSHLSPAGVDLPELDITSFSQTTAYIAAQKPDVVINCAAYTAVDACEDNIDLAFRVNGEGVKNLAIACERVGADLVHISTDYVFDGTKDSPYIEIDKTNPLSVYGKSKLYGEQMLMNHTNRFYILRTQWLYGSGGNNFVKTMLQLSRDRKSVSVVNDQFGNPTFSADLAKLIAEIITTGQYGLYHATNSGGISWHRFAQDIFRIANIGMEVVPVTSDQFVRRATRPKFSILDNMALRLAGFKQMRGYQEALADYLKTISIT